MKYKFFNYFGSDRPFFRSFMVLFSGNATAQAISIISLPFLTRLYSPEQFGVLALVISISMMLAILLTLRYEVSLVLADYDELKSIIKLISICIVSLIPLAVGCIYLYGFFSNEIEGNITNIVLLSIALAYLSVSNYLLTKFKMFSILSTSRVIQAVFTILFQFILFDLSIGEGLIYGYLLGIGVSLSYILIMSGIRLENVENNNIRSLAVKYIKFPMFNAPQAFLNSMASSAVLFFIGISFGPSFVGFYSLGVRIIQTPMSLISKSISSLTLSELSNAKFDNYEKSKLLEKRTFQLFFICIAFGFFAYLLIPFAFSFVFSNDWLPAVSYSQYLLFWFLAVFLATPSMSAIQVFGLQKYFLVYELVLVLFRLLLIYLFYVGDYSADLFVMCFSILGAVFNLILVFWVHVRIRQLEI